MKKIGIITFHDSYNYGAFLQAKATELILKELGHKPIIINYINKEELSQRKIISYSKQYSLLKNLRQISRSIYIGILHKEFFYGKNNFRKYINKYNLTRKYFEKEDIEKNEEFDLLLSGSDQIWNPKICNGKLDTTFLLDFHYNTPKISFSSSMGSYKPNDRECKQMRKLLNEFKEISVREEYCKDILEKYMEKNIKVVMDPTLFITKEVWLSQDINKDKFEFLNSSEFILVYNVTGYKGKEEFVKALKERTNLKTVLISLDNRKREYIDYVINNANPFEFIYLIDKAKYIITESFHGTIFSFNLKKNFISIYNKHNPYRVENFLEKFEMKDRIIKDHKQIASMNIDVDYSSVSQRFELIRKDNIKWLESAIE